MDLVVARPDDVDAIMALRDAAATWLLGKGVQQWRPGELPRTVIERRVAAGDTFVARGGADGIHATVTIDFADEHTWGSRGVDGTAGYVHTLVVHPDAAGDGLGREIMRWSEARVAAQGRVACRLDCAEGNAALQDWYRRLGYVHVGRRDYGSAWFAVVLLERRLAARGSEPTTAT